MTTEEKKIRLAIRKTLMELENVSESDILTRAGVNWQEMKPKFLETVNNLVSKIDDDQYNDAEDLIGKAVGMLKVWKAKMHKGIGMVDRVSNIETLDEIGQLDEMFGDGFSSKYGDANGNIGFGGNASEMKKLKDIIIRLIKTGADKEELKTKITSIIDNYEPPKNGGFW